MNFAVGIIGRNGAGKSTLLKVKLTIQAAHPGFFKRMDYEKYAQLQSDSAEEIMTLGESMGKKYDCLNQTLYRLLKSAYTRMRFRWREEVRFDSL